MGERDLAVVGAGPAGLAAAVAAAEQGLRVVLVDAGRQLGGQYWRHPDESSRSDAEEDSQRLGRRYTDLRARFDALVGSGRIDHVSGHQVWFVERTPAGFTLRLTPTIPSAPGARRVDRASSGAIVLCPGAFDRQLPVPGWELPGVMAAGGVQALLKGHRSVAGRRVVVAGTGPFLLPVAAGLAREGATVVGVCEASAPSAWARVPLGAVALPSKALEATGYATALARHRIPYRARTVVTAIHGDERVESVSLGSLDRCGRLRTGTARPDLEVDLVAFGWGFTPSLDLVTALGVATRVDVDESLVAVADRWQRTDVQGVYVAGEATGVGGALLAQAEGELAGLTAARDAGRAAPGDPTRRLQRRIARYRRFAVAMHRAHPVPAGWQEWLKPDTTVCRCEEVTLGDLHAAREELHATDARTVKLLARAGMGWCQGRVCGFATAKLAAGDRSMTVTDLAPMSKRTLAAPITLGELAALDERPPEGSSSPGVVAP